jgi:hypothetical protein
MNAMKIARVLSLLLLRLSPSAQQKTYTCNIAVPDALGATIGKAHLFVYRDSIGNVEASDKILDADQLGRAKLDLSSGFYDVCALSADFTPTCRKVRMTNRDIQVRFKLVVSPEVEAVIADRFPPPLFR